MHVAFLEGSATKWAIFDQAKVLEELPFTLRGRNEALLPSALAHCPAVRLLKKGTVGFDPPGGKMRLLPIQTVRAQVRYGSSVEHGSSRSHANTSTALAFNTAPHVLLSPCDQNWWRGFGEPADIGYVKLHAFSGLAPRIPFGLQSYLLRSLDPAGTHPSPTFSEGRLEPYKMCSSCFFLLEYRQRLARGHPSTSDPSTLKSMGSRE